MSAGQVRIPALPTRSGALWLGITAVAVLGVLGYLAVTQPELLAAVVVVAVLFAVLVAVLLTRRTWLDPAAGTVTWRRWLVLTTTVRLADATRVAVRGAAVQALLDVRAGRQGGHVLLLVAGDYGARSQSPEMLRLLADTVERHVPTKVGADAVGRLRAQAKHMAAGGTPETSPLAKVTSKGLVRAAGGIGAAGGGLGAS